MQRAELIGRLQEVLAEIEIELAVLFGSQAHAPGLSVQTDWEGRGRWLTQI